MQSKTFFYPEYYQYHKNVDYCIPLFVIEELSVEKYVSRPIVSSFWLTLHKYHNMLIIGITGTLGAGKGTIVDYLVGRKGFKHLSVRGYLIEIIRQRELPVNRDTMVQVANELRSKNSPSFIVDELYNEAAISNQNCIIESIRTPGEVSSLRSKSNFILLAVDADPLVRYQRISIRNSETDKISFMEFLDNEKREMKSNDPNNQNIGKCMEMADYVFSNNGTVNDLERSVDSALSMILNK